MPEHRSPSRASRHDTDAPSAGRVIVRPSAPSDREFVLGLAPRLGDFDPPPWRTSEEIARGEVEVLRRHFTSPAEGTALLVAELPAGRPAGFAFLETYADYFTGRPHAHVGILAVSADAEGRGVARTLLEHAERWAIQRGYPVVTLNVFDRNARAIALYERMGYEREVVRFRKACHSS